LYSRFNILAKASFLGVVVRGHVSGTTTSGGEDGGLESGSLEVLVGEWGVRGIGDVARAATAVGGSHCVYGCGRCVGWMVCDVVDKKRNYVTVHRSYAGMKKGDRK